MESRSQRRPNAKTSSNDAYECRTSAALVTFFSRSIGKPFALSGTIEQNREPASEPVGRSTSMIPRRRTALPKASIRSTGDIFRPLSKTDRHRSPDTYALTPVA